MRRAAKQAASNREKSFSPLRPSSAGDAAKLGSASRAAASVSLSRRSPRRSFVPFHVRVQETVDERPIEFCSYTTRPACRFSLPLLCPLLDKPIYFNLRHLDPDASDQLVALSFL